MAEGTRLITSTALAELSRAARSRRAPLAMQDPEREFYLGVEAAAEEHLHPEQASAHAPAWLDRQHLLFREGYQKASAVIATAAVLRDPEVHLMVPEPDH